MSKRICLIVLAVAVIVGAGATFAQPEPTIANQATGPGTGSIVPPRAPSVVLYDQTGSPSGNGAPDQDFEAAFDAYDSEGADDFDVTFPDGWTVDGVGVIGTQSLGGTPTAINIFFYDDAAGLPGAAPICSYPGQTNFAGNDSITTTLDTPCLLPAGTYWVSHQVTQAFGTSGQHFWSGQALAATSGSPGVWRNPNNGFGTGCTSWTAQSTCGVGGGVADDWMFQILGVEGGAGVPTVPFAGLLILMAVLLGVGLVVLVRR